VDTGSVTNLGPSSSPELQPAEHLLELLAEALPCRGGHGLERIHHPLGLPLGLLRDPDQAAIGVRQHSAIVNKPLLYGADSGITGQAVLASRPVCHR
jgi:hypothetical protein